MNKQDEVIAEAMTWLRTPYHHQGNIKGVGVDCAMILVEVYKTAGLIPGTLDPRPYPRDWHLHREEEKYLGWIEQYGEKVAVPQKGDVVVYQFGRCISHGGIVVNWPQIIHSYISDGCVLADGNQGMLSGRVRGFYRIKGIDQ